jgi:hypothetical protein
MSQQPDEISDLRNLIRRQAKALERAQEVLRFLRSENWGKDMLEWCWCGSNTTVHTAPCQLARGFTEEMARGLPQL